MKKLNYNRLGILFIAFLSPVLHYCTQPKAGKPTIFYVNSYHRGHPSSDEIMDAISEEFSPDSFRMVTCFMDTKRNPYQDYIEKRAAQINDTIKKVNPDIVIVSDDDAVKYLIQKYFRKSAIPVVFCGVNWSDKDYQLEEVRITGMIEILPLADVLMTIKSYYPAMKKVMVLNENTTTSRKEKILLDSLFNRRGFTAGYELVDDFSQWKTKFEEANRNYDLIYISTNAAVKGWKKEEAVNFISSHISVPVVTCEDFMMPYAVLGITKVAGEQGTWAAESAIRILNGVNPSDIPRTMNRQRKIWLNATLAGKINFQPDRELKDKALIIND